MNNFSVVMVTYDGEYPSRLKACMLSIVNQTLIPNEVIICLNGDVREDIFCVIREYMDKLNIILLKNKKSTLAENLNIGIEKAKHNIIVRCDSDDISLPERFEKQVNFLINSNYDIVGANIIERINLSQRIKSNIKGLVKKNHYSRFFRNPVNHNACAFKKSSIEKFRYSPGRMEDFILWSKLLNSNYKIYNIDEVMLLADANGLAERRIGKEYRKAEINLFVENFNNNGFYGKFLALCSFLLRYPFRFSISIVILKLFYHLSRKKYW